MQKVNLAEKFALFDDYWNPKITADLNDSSYRFQASRPFQSS
jgi:hypothetical protein